eukprot:365122-Chlamydomonas_euryale.AAC.29
MKVLHAACRVGRLDRRHVHVRVAGVHGTAGLEELVTRNDDRIEHRLAQQEVAHPLGDDHVDLLGQLNALDRALDNLDHIVQLCIMGEGRGGQQGEVWASVRGWSGQQGSSGARSICMVWMHARVMRLCVHTCACIRTRSRMHACARGAPAFVCVYVRMDMHKAAGGIGARCWEHRRSLLGAETLAAGRTGARCWEHRRSLLGAETLDAGSKDAHCWEHKRSEIALVRVIHAP